MTSQFKTVFLLVLLSAIIIAIGGMIGGRGGVIIAFIFALIMNVGSYWYSDSIVLRAYNARELAPDQAPNAFATGRDPEHAVVAVTEGLLQILQPDEIRGVLAHEMAHIAHRDILIQTVAGVMASTITALANFLQFASFFGGARDDEGNRVNPLVGLLMALLAPIAASIIQLGISRSREYLADAGGAQYSGNPLYLASALKKLDAYSKQIPMEHGNAATAEMFIVEPMYAVGSSFANLFSTHPPIEDRIARLEEMARTGHIG